MADEIKIPVEIDDSKVTKKIETLGDNLGKSLQKAISVQLIAAELGKLTSSFDGLAGAEVRAAALGAQGFAAGGPWGAAIGFAVGAIQEGAKAWGAYEEQSRIALTVSTEASQRHAIVLRDIAREVAETLRLTAALNTARREGIELDEAQRIQQQEAASAAVFEAQEGLARAKRLRQDARQDIFSAGGGATDEMREQLRIFEANEERQSQVLAEALARRNALEEAFRAEDTKSTLKAEVEKTKIVRDGADEALRKRKRALDEEGRAIEASLDREIAFRKKIADEARREGERRTKEEAQAREVERRFRQEVADNNAKATQDRIGQDAELAKARKKAEAEIRDAAIEGVTSVGLAIADAAAGFAETEQEKRRLQAIGFAIEAAGEVAKSVAAFADFNIPGGIGHAAAAVKFGIAAAMAGGGGGGGGGGGAPAAGAAKPQPARSAGTGRGGGSGGDAPASVVVNVRGALATDTEIYRAVNLGLDRARRNRSQAQG